MHTHEHTDFYRTTVARTHKNTHIFPRTRKKSSQDKTSSHVWSRARKCPPKWSLSTHKLSNIRVVACAVEHTHIHTHMLQEQCSLLRTCMKLTETCIPRTLKMAVHPDFPRTWKCPRKKNVLVTLVQGTKMSPPSEVSQTHTCLQLLAHLVHGI